MNGTGKRLSARNKRLIRTGIAAALLTVVLAAAFLIIKLANGAGCTALMPTDEPSVSPTAEPAPIVTPTQTPDPEPDIELTPLPVYGMVAAGDKLSYGLSSVGLLSYIGQTNGRADCYNWRGVSYIAVTDGFTAALTDDGRVLIAGDEALSAAVADWSDVSRLCCTNTAVYALSSDGRLLSTDSDVNSLLLTDIELITAGKDYFIALRRGHEPFTAGNAPELSAFDGKAIIELSSSGTHTVALTRGGQLVSTREGDPFDGALGCVRVFAGEGCTAYIDADGTLHTDCAAIVSDAERLDGLATVVSENGRETALIRAAEWFSASGTHALVLLKSGEVSGFGENDFLQCAVDEWRLLPYIAEGGYVLGLAPSASGEAGVKTGDAYTLPDGASGTAVILGDIDQNGIIDLDDLALLLEYLAGRTELSDVQLQAADILRDASKPGAVDRADSEQLRYHLSGYTVIDQYAKRFTYSGEIADAERINGDACGYIRVLNTNIDAPVMYGKDFYYHYHSPSGASSSRGSIYLYYDFPSKNSVITGHNLRKAGIMLHELHLIQDKYAKDYGDFSKRTWAINLFGETHLYEVFAMYEEKPSDPSKSSQYYNCTYNHTMESLSDEQIREWIRYQLDRTELDYVVDVRPNDRFITILTCSDAHWESELGGRLYFFLRMVDGH